MMKKLKICGLLAAIMVLAFGITFIACSGGDSTDNGEVEGIDYLRIPGTYDGQEAETIISHSSKAAAAYAMVTGDYYILRYYDGSKPLETISRGTIVWEDPKITFNPEDGSASFEGYYSENSFVITSPGWKPNNKVPSGGGGGGIGSGQPVIIPGQSYTLSVSTGSVTEMGAKLPIYIDLQPSVSPSILIRAVDSGSYTYTAKLLNVIISTGAAVVDIDGNVLFTPSGGSTFTYDGATNTISGTITLNAQMKADIATAAGFVVAIPDTIDLEGDLSEGGEKNGAAYWNGTWIRETLDGDPTLQKIVFSGANYTLTYPDGITTETGTFVYCSNLAGEGDNDCLFIFSRDSDGSLAVYRWEGQAGDPDPALNWIELYNEERDPLGIALDNYWEPDPTWPGAPAIPIGPYDTGFNPATDQAAWDAYSLEAGKYPRLFQKQ